MPIGFNALLQTEGLNPAEVRLLRHHDNRAGRARTVYRLWRDDPASFELYQSHQRSDRRAYFAASFWASFVVAPDDSVLFVGLYSVLDCSPSPTIHTNPLSGVVSEPGTVDVYRLQRASQLADVSGRLVVAWGPGTRSFVHRADQQNKPILELRKEFQEAAFPGYSQFMAQLSEIEKLPPTWASALSANGGVYLITCPRTNEQYVGSATGVERFLGRWLCYAQTGHGGNVALKSRDPSDYRVSILELAGSASDDEILKMEARWKLKLQSREMGLNRN